MVDFKETAYEIFKICIDITLSDGCAAEKIEEILKQIYEKGWNEGVNYEQRAYE